MEEDRKKSIGRNLQRLRKEAGFKSAKAFAEKAGINPGTYTSYEQGERSFTYETAWDMADALDVSLDELGGRDFPGEGFAATAEERGLVDSYRRMDEEDKPGFMSTARALAYAGEAKKEGKGADVALAGDDVRERV